MAIKINAENMVNKAKGYFNPRQPIGNLPGATKKTRGEVSAAVESYKNSHAPIEKLPPKISVDTIAEAYKAAHGIV